MSDHTNESLQSKFNRYMTDKYRKTGHIPSLGEYEAAWYAFLETHDTEDDE